MDNEAFANMLSEGHPVWDLTVADGVSPVDLKGLKELSERMDRTQWRTLSDVAQVVANYLRCHPSVEVVRYPGLKGDPLFEEAAHTLESGFGPVVGYCVAGEWHVLSCEASDVKQFILQLEQELA